MNPRLTELLDRYLDAAISPGEAGDLEALLSASDEARAMFWKRARLHSALRIVAQERLGKRMAGEPQPRVVAMRPRVVARPSISQRKTPRRSWWVPLAAAAVVVLAAIAAWKNFAPGKAASPQNIATLTRAADAVWADAAAARQTGQALQAGWLRLKSGAVQVEFSRGARVVVEGPAEFQLVSDNEGRLALGKLWARVPPSAHGFTVRGRDFTAVDLGTEFGCSVPASGPAEVHVFGGAVEVNARQLREMQALQLAATPREIPAQRGAFIGEEQMPERPAFLRGSRSEEDIGNPGKRGSTTLNPSPGVWTVAGGGADIYGARDQFHFVSQEFAGDGTFIAKVSAVEKTNDYAKAGLMLRDSMQPDSAYAFVFTGPTTIGFEFRTAAGRHTSHMPYAPGRVPVWLKLVRRGGVVTAWHGPDGQRWMPLGKSLTLPLTTSAHAGLAVTAHNDATLNHSTFENVSAQP